MTVKVGILGAGGRMGAALIAAVGATPVLQLAGLAERAGHPAVGSKVVDKLTVCANATAIAHSCDVLCEQANFGELLQRDQTGTKSVVHVVIVVGDFVGQIADLCFE